MSEPAAPERLAQCDAQFSDVYFTMVLTTGPVRAAMTNRHLLCLHHVDIRR